MALTYHSKVNAICVLVSLLGKFRIADSFRAEPVTLHSDRSRVQAAGASNVSGAQTTYGTDSEPLTDMTYSQGKVQLRHGVHGGQGPDWGYAERKSVPAALASPV